MIIEFVPCLVLYQYELLIISVLANKYLSIHSFVHDWHLCCLFSFISVLFIYSKNIFSQFSIFISNMNCCFFFFLCTSLYIVIFLFKYIISFALLFTDQFSVRCISNLLKLMILFHKTGTE